MTTSLEQQVQRLVDEEEIRQVIYRRARGTDHKNTELVLSCYHDGATEDHEGFNGPIRDYLTKASPVFHGKTEIEVNVHLLGNTEITIDGNRADCTSTFICGLTVSEDGVRRDYMNAGRYVDTMEKRDGAWKIRHRRCEYEWSHGEPCTDRWWSRASRSPTPTS